MEKGINYQKMKKKLLEIYEGFIKKPDDEKVKKRAFEMYTNYMGIDNVVPDYISNGVSYLSNIFQMGKEGFEKETVLEGAKEILEDLKKSEQ